MYICADNKVRVEVKVGYETCSEDTLFASVRTCAGIFSVDSSFWAFGKTNV